MTKPYFIYICIFLIYILHLKSKYCWNSNYEAVLLPKNYSLCPFIFIEYVMQYMLNIEYTHKRKKSQLKQRYSCVPVLLNVGGSSMLVDDVPSVF